MAQNVCPMEPEAIEQPLTHRLQCQDPQVVQRYNHILWEALQSSSIAEQAQHLAAQVHQQLSTKQQEEYEAINQAAMEYKRNAEKQCRKIQAGAIPWCPLVSMAINYILYWKGLQKRLNRQNIGSSVIKHWAKTGGILNHAHNYHLEDQTIQENICKVYKSFHQLKIDPDQHDTWIVGIIRAQATMTGSTTKALW